jgi:hypothetical protein
LKGYIEEGVVERAGYIVEKSTVMSEAKRIGISKSAVHKDVTKRKVCFAFSLPSIEGGKSI